jgi:hypothetical protein
VRGFTSFLNLRLLKVIASDDLIPTAHKCPKCDDKRFSRTSNLYRHMRTCKGTASSKSPTDEAFRSEVRLANSTKAAVSEGAQSSRSASPTPSATSYSSSPQQGSSSVATRGVSPDPNWGPNPLASWKPTRRRHTLSSFPMPISQRVYLGNLPMYNNNVGASPTTTPSPSSLVPFMAVSLGTPPGLDSRTSDSAGTTEGIIHQRPGLDWLATQKAPSPCTQSPVAGDAALRGIHSHIQPIPSGRLASTPNNLQSGKGNFEVVSPEPLGPNSYKYDFMPSTSRLSSDGLSIATNSPADEEALRYFVMMKSAVPGWTPSPPPVAGTIVSPRLIGASNTAGAYSVTRAVEAQEDAIRREQDAQGESLWNAYVDPE